MRAFVIHGGDHGNDRFAVRKRENGHFGTFEKFFDHQARAAFAEHFVFHHGACRRDRFLSRLRDDHPFAEGEPVRFYHDGNGACSEISEGGRQIAEGFVSRGRDPVFFHQVFCENLASFDDRRLLFRSETGNADFFEFVCRAENEGIVRGDHGVIDLVFFCKIHDRGDIFRSDRNAGRVARDAAVSGQNVNFGHLRVFFQFFDDGVFSSSAADDHDFHIASRSPYRNMRLSAYKRVFNDGKALIP